MFPCTCSWPDAVITLVTSALFPAKLIGSWDLVFKIVVSTDRNEFDMLFLLLAHLFTHSIPMTVGQTSSGGLAESLAGAQMSWTWVAVRGDPRRV